LGPGYDEATARKEFIDKFWIALGWDVNYETQTNPYQQEVKVERRVTTNEMRKRRLRIFRAELSRCRFFVEAKSGSKVDPRLPVHKTFRRSAVQKIPEIEDLSYNHRMADVFSREQRSKIMAVARIFKLRSNAGGTPLAARM
jgi:hypothetical protein